MKQFLMTDLCSVNFLLMCRVGSQAAVNKVGAAMGMILGKITVETPKYKSLEKKEDIEIREYDSAVVAEVTYDPKTMKSGRDGGFMILAGYIGAIGTPCNKKGSEPGEKIAMTAPVITQEHGGAEKIAMTAPVITKEEDGGEAKNGMVTMQFVLPSNYTLETAPTPTDDRVKLKEFPNKTYGVITFSGTANSKLEEQQLQKLRSSLETDGYKIVGPHLLARYNPPWTPWFLKTNEVMIPVEK
ncbi:hypothetical protein KC19_3G234500 [Ceratodon purpureus]|uniref:SOUL heme-binding protein n=1 Tax=Ceratodon purpureus TaxID=3225 RepID=A0A8T0IM05_CERPU|nr:hypothetical protein KC19_3G234500 [Ceratodon purpureus]